MKNKLIILAASTIITILFISFVFAYGNGYYMYNYTYNMHNANRMHGNNIMSLEYNTINYRSSMMSNSNMMNYRSNQNYRMGYYPNIMRNNNLYRNYRIMQK